jgi:hypothetical protein
LALRFSIFDWRRARAPWLAALACLFLAGWVHAEVPAAQSKIDNQKSKIGSPYLWKITPPGGGATSWLFGTIHLQRPDVARLIPAVQTALDHSNAVYTELPMDTATMLGIAPRLVLPKDQTLDALLGPKLTADLQSELKLVNPLLTLGPLNHLKPWAIAATLLELGDQLKYPMSQPLDILIYQRGAEAHKEVGGIETVDEQLAIFDDLSPADQVALVRETIGQLREVRAKDESASDILARLYLAGDLDKLVAELMKWDAAGADPQLEARLMDRLLYRRDAIMAERMLGKLREHPSTSYFFAVGAAHLQGDRGLLASLRKAGYRLDRVQ